MQFHEYQNIRNRWAIQSDAEFLYVKMAKKMRPYEFRDFLIRNSTDQINSGRHSDQVEEWHRIQLQSAFMEADWVNHARPYYNIWPVVFKLSQTVKLDVPMRTFELPFSTMLLRFSLGHEPFGIATAILHWNKRDRGFVVHCRLAHSTNLFSLSFGQYELDETFEGYVEKFREKLLIDTWELGPEGDFDEKVAFPSIIRLAVFVALLSAGEDMITPVVLSADQQRYDETGDEEIKNSLERRAARRLGRGFDVGKKMQLEKDRSPHWRNPHFALFWIGPGRTKPVIMMRKGAVVQKASMAEVPTGYFGLETDAEDSIPPAKTPRETFSKSRRFLLMKRDEFRCQLCGNSQAEGAVLHIDHRVPLSKGGSNEDENLWTLCNDCNLGKADRDL